MDPISMIPISCQHIKWTMHCFHIACFFSSFKTKDVMVLSRKKKDSCDTDFCSIELMHHFYSEKKIVQIRNGK